MLHFLYEEYRYRHRRSAGHYRNVRLLGVVPLGLVALMTYIQGLRAGPGLWCAFGLAIAVHMMLWSARNLHVYQARQSATAARLVAASDRWYPGALVVCQNAFVAITTCILWFTITQMGFPTSAAENVLLVAVLVLYPMRRLVLMRPPNQRGQTAELWDELLHYAGLSCSSVLIALVITSLAMPPDVPLTAGLSPLLMIVWLFALLIVLSCIILFVDHMVRKRPLARGNRAGSVQSPQDSLP